MGTQKAISDRQELRAAIRRNPVVTRDQMLIWIVVAHSDPWKSTDALRSVTTLSRGRVPLPEGNGGGNGTPGRLWMQYYSARVVPGYLSNGTNWTIASTSMLPAAGLPTAGAAGHCDSEGA